MAIVKLAPNVPVEIEAKYADIYPGEHGPQICLKGKVGDDATAKIYIDANHGLDQLVAAGAAPHRNYDLDAIPEKGLNVKLSEKKLVVAKNQAAGEKNAKLAISVKGKPAPAAGNGAAPPLASTVAASNGTNGHTVSCDAREKLSAAYDKATEHVLEKVVPMYRAAKIEPTASDIGSMVATLFIAATRNS